MTAALQIIQFLQLIFDLITKYGIPAGRKLQDAWGIPEDEVDERILALPDKLTPFEEYFKEDL